MNTGVLVILTIILAVSWVVKLEAVREQFAFLYYNPLEDPDSKEYLMKHGPKKTIQWHHRTYVFTKSFVPVATLVALLMCFVLDSWGLSGDTPTNIIFYLTVGLLAWHIISTLRNVHLAAVFSRKYPPLSLRTREALDAEEEASIYKRLQRKET